jgi:hypothetical protein
MPALVTMRPIKIPRRMKIPKRIDAPIENHAPKVGGNIPSISFGGGIIFGGLPGNVADFRYIAEMPVPAEHGQAVLEGKSSDPYVVFGNGHDQTDDDEVLINGFVAGQS